jgi:membrane glycosyltransferase
MGFAISWATFFWFMPIVAGLLLAPVVSWATGLPALGRWMQRANIFRIPEEKTPAAIPVDIIEAVPVLQAAE